MEYFKGDLNDGDMISCKIQGRIIKEAKVRVIGRKIHICQDVANGKAIPKAMRYGYKYAWLTRYPESHIMQSVSDIVKLNDEGNTDMYEIF